MKACPNAQCPHRLRYGSPAPFFETSSQCHHCAAPLAYLEPMPSPQVAPTMRTRRHQPSMPALVTPKRGPQLSEGVLFFLGVSGVVIPHVLARFVGNIAYALPVIALAYVVLRIMKSAARPATFAPEPTTLTR